MEGLHDYSRIYRFIYEKRGKGIYRFELDEQTGTIVEVETGYELEASTYVNQHDSFLYAVTREGEDCGIASFKIDQDGKISFINKCLASTKGSGCYVSVSPNGKYILKQFMVQDWLVFMKRIRLLVKLFV